MVDSAVLESETYRQVHQDFKEFQKNFIESLAVSVDNTVLVNICSSSEVECKSKSGGYKKANFHSFNISDEQNPSDFILQLNEISTNKKFVIFLAANTEIINKNTVKELFKLPNVKYKVIGIGSKFTEKQSNGFIKDNTIVIEEEFDFPYFFSTLFEDIRNFIG